MSGADLVSYDEATDNDLVERLRSGEAPQMLDVRAPYEFENIRIAGSVGAYVPELRAGLPDGLDPDEDVWVMCGTGNRATIAAALVERHGARPVVVAKGGVTTVLDKLEVVSEA